jgi:hypothetical protein
LSNFCMSLIFSPYVLYVCHCDLQEAISMQWEIASLGLDMPPKNIGLLDQRSQ